MFLLVNHCISNLSPRSSFNPASFLSIALETLSMCVFLHSNAAVGEDFCLTINHTSFSTCAVIAGAGGGPEQQGVNIILKTIDMQELGGDSVGWYLLLSNIYFFSTAAPKSHQSVSVSWPTIGSPLPTLPPCPPHPL